VTCRHLPAGLYPDASNASMEMTSRDRDVGSVVRGRRRLWDDGVNGMARVRVRVLEAQVSCSSAINYLQSVRSTKYSAVQYSTGISDVGQLLQVAAAPEPACRSL